ncbi:MAG: carboxypeptidase-like regulatory domain-containing protein, partial [Planctomycetota bacterium]
MRALRWTVPLLAAVLALWLLLGEGAVRRRAERTAADRKPPAGEPPPVRPARAGVTSPPPPTPAEARRAAARARREAGVEWAVRILGAHDLPAPRITFIARWGMFGWAGETDDEGRARFFVSPDVRRVTLTSEEWRPRVQVADSPDAVLRFPELIPVVVRVVHAVTGREVAGASAGFGKLLRSFPPRPLPRLGGGSYFVVLRGESFKKILEVSLPDGLAADRAALEVEGVVSRFADSLRVDLPVWPEAEITLRVRDEDGRPVQFPLLKKALLDNRPLAVSTEIDGAAGRMRVRGVPFIPGERIRLVAADGAFEAEAVVGIEKGRRSYEATAVIPGEQFTVTTSSVIGIGGGAGGGRRGRGGSRRLLARRPARLDVTAVHRDGRAATGIRVGVKGGDPPVERWQRTTDHGQAAFVKLPPGRYDVQVHEPGFIDTEQEVVLVEDGRWI